ncbi:MAG: Hsp20/alpha crystallin family protein [Chlamydiae bacterium]|nr:MAG: Hsp20/alpha crystallin family protein [Chlamydiota bacterium]
MLLPTITLPKPSLNILGDIHKLRNEMNRLFEGELPFVYRNEFPPINMKADEDSITVTAEVSGLNEQEIKSSVKGDILNISGKRMMEAIGENDVAHRNERFTGEFSRTIKLPAKVNADAVSATYKNGILTLTLPRAEEEKAKKIEIKVA